MTSAEYLRWRTAGLLLRYFRASLSLGRIPSLLGSDYSCARTRHRTRPQMAIEDVVLFLCDIERCLAEFSPRDRRLLAFCIFEHRTEWEAARAFRQAQSAVSRRLAELLDLLYLQFTRKGLMLPSPLDETLSADPDSDRLSPRSEHAELTEEESTALPEEPDEFAEGGPFDLPAGEEDDDSAAAC
jgi:hypothetical protein